MKLIYQTIGKCLVNVLNISHFGGTKELSDNGWVDDTMRGFHHESRDLWWMAAIRSDFSADRIDTNDGLITGEAQQKFCWHWLHCWYRTANATENLLRAVVSRMSFQLWLTIDALFECKHFSFPSVLQSTQSRNQFWVRLIFKLKISIDCTAKRISSVESVKRDSPLNHRFNSISISIKWKSDWISLNSCHQLICHRIWISNNFSFCLVKPIFIILFFIEIFQTFRHSMVEFKSAKALFFGINSNNWNSYLIKAEYPLNS